METDRPSLLKRSLINRKHTLAAAAHRECGGCGDFGGKRLYFKGNTAFLLSGKSLEAGLDSRRCEAETAVVYLADKRIQGTKRVTLEEWFEASKEK